jgi:SAM-dependent methyltransferase
MSRYEYLPADRMDFATAVGHVQARGYTVAEAMPQCSPEAIAGMVASRGIRTEDLTVDLTDLSSYLASARYEEDFPLYYGQRIKEKSLEHFVALRLLDIKEDDVFIDIASELSPAPTIFQRITGATTYSQDIMYPDGITGNMIGGDACAMPIPDSFATKAMLTCSLEHFENDGDTLLFKELARVVRRNGRVCVLPLYIAGKCFTLTDPTMSVPANVEFDRDGPVICREGWGNRHGRFYDAETLLRRIIEPARALFDFTVFRVTNAPEVDQSAYLRFALLAERR